MKRALILGVGGMDGSHLADLLLEKGYEVHGLVRRSSVDNLTRLTAETRARVRLHRGDVTEPVSVTHAFYEAGLSAGDEVYNLADQDEVGWSLDVPGESWRTTYGGCATVLEVVRRRNPRIKVFQPVSSTVFGDAPAPQSEDTPLAPRSPYACAKAAAWLLCKHYRREHGVFVSCGVFFNHTSPRQKGTYLLPTIARQAVEVARGTREMIRLTGPNSVLDVGWAPDYVEAAWRMLQQDAPGDYCVGTGAGHWVSRLCSVALTRAGALAGAFAIDDTTGGPKTVANANRVRGLGWGPSGDSGPLHTIERLVDYYKGQ